MEPTILEEFLIRKYNFYMRLAGITHEYRLGVTDTIAMIADYYPEEMPNLLKTVYTEVP